LGQAVVPCHEPVEKAVAARRSSDTSVVIMNPHQLIKILVFSAFCSLAAQAVNPVAGISGLWFDPALNGEGYNIIVAPGGVVIFYYGYSKNGERLWLISDTLSGSIPFATPITVSMSQGQGGNFDLPAAPPDGLKAWGNLSVTFNSCTSASFELSGDDGSKLSKAVQLAPIDGLQCDSSAQCLSGSGKPACLPSFKSLNLYSAQSIWNMPVPADATLAPDNATLSQSLVASGDIAIQLRQFSAPVYFVKPDTPRYDVVVACGTAFDLGVSKLLGVPIPDFAEPANDIDGADNPVPATACGQDSDQDNHMVLVDLDRRCEYGLWQARKVNGVWYSSLPANISMDSDGVYPGGVNDRASGFPFLAGMIWPDELAAGRIEHALLFSYAFTRSGGPVPPAKASDGITSDASAIPMGARVRLDPSLDLDILNLQPYERTIAEALQTYGMYLGDTGGEAGGTTTLGLYAVDPKSVTGTPYLNVLPNEDFPPVHLPLDRLQVLSFGPQDPNATDNASLDDGPCSSFQRP